MVYYDDILNVYAYLQSKSKENLSATRTWIAGHEELSARVSELNSQADDLLAQASALAGEMEIDISDIASEAEKPQTGLTQEGQEEQLSLQVHLPKDFDFQKDFQMLCEEAHAAGFTDAHPEDLLSYEEMQRAEAFDRELDARFAEGAQLRQKDILVLMIAVAVRTVLCLVKKAAEHLPAKEKDLWHELESCKEAAGNNLDLAAGLAGVMQGPAEVRSHSQILRERAPFDIAGNERLQRKDLLGFDRYLGWLFGVCNILTDTVTTYKLKSYEIIRPQAAAAYPQIGKEAPTWAGVVFPVVRNISCEKEAMIAAIIKEACLLGYCKGGGEEIGQLFLWAVELEERKDAAWERTKSVLSGCKAEWAERIGGEGMDSFFHTLVAAVHAVLYDGGDGSKEMYAVRTNKIILYADAMTAAIGSLPAIMKCDVESLDFRGIISVCLGWFQSTRFWIEAKSNFLFSEYKKEIDKEMREIDQYFVFG